MKGLIQRVSRASVSVDEQIVAEIPTGLLLLLGVEPNDGSKEALALAKKVVGYRVFADDQGRMNRSLLDIDGALLVVPQFTLAADTGSGTRPGFSTAAPPAVAERLFQEFLGSAESLLPRERVGRGRFGADMKVSLINDGPVTFMLQVGDSS